MTPTYDIPFQAVLAAARLGEGFCPRSHPGLARLEPDGTCLVCQEWARERTGLGGLRVVWRAHPDSPVMVEARLISRDRGGDGVLLTIARHETVSSLEHAATGMGSVAAILDAALAEAVDTTARVRGAVA